MSSPELEGAPPGPLPHGPSSVSRVGLATSNLTKRTGNQSESPEKAAVIDNREESIEEGSKPFYDHTHRKLKPRHVQLIGIGGTIGTALYVQIGQTLAKGGPGSLFIAYTLCHSISGAQRLLFGMILNLPGLAEMVTYLPISSPFIRFAGRYVDDAFGVAAGYNFFVFEAAMVPMEVTACSSITGPTQSLWQQFSLSCSFSLRAFLNVFAVRWYGESEFWLASSKVLLSVGLILFTFITMLGGNPLNDRFGFRYWNEPGSFAEYYKEGDLGRWLGFLACLINASFTIAGPDYISMAAGESVNPRGNLPKAYNGMFYRLTAFFVLGALCVGILVPYNDKTMADAFDNDAPGAAASPYVIAMDRLGIPVLPHIVNTMILLAVFSAGNSYVYCSSRTLYGLALDNKAPRLFTKCTKSGVPIYCVAAVLLIGLISFLQISNSASVVLNWIISLVTASQLINFSVITFTYTRFRKALIAQGISRDTLPYRSLGQPYVAYFALASTIVMAFVGGYEVFLPGKWDVPTFLFSYTMIGVFPVIYFGWKTFHRTSIRKPEEIDLVTGVEEIEEYTRNYIPEPASNPISRFGDWLFS
ncbi:amino acid permease/ SLC12A domain-containing protein [Aspergillus desertorum]